MASHGVSICVPCRHVTKIGAGCPAGHGMIYMGKRWRAPSKHNDTAWKRIEAGDVFWDKRVKIKWAVERWPRPWPREPRRVGGRILPVRPPY